MAFPYKRGTWCINKHRNDGASITQDLINVFQEIPEKLFQDFWVWLGRACNFHTCMPSSLPVSMCLKTLPNETQGLVQARACWNRKCSNTNCWHKVKPIIVWNITKLWTLLRVLSCEIKRLHLCYGSSSRYVILLCKIFQASVATQIVNKSSSVNVLLQKPGTANPWQTS